MRWRYLPNSVPLALRLTLGLICFLWVAWALTGVISGHMYFMWRPLLHFSGVGAFILSAAVLVAAIACFVPIVDHYDRRDNESSYGRARRWLWWAVAAIALSAILIGCAGRVGVGVPGLLDARRMSDLLLSATITRWLQPHASLLYGAMLVSACALLLCALLMSAFGVRGKDDLSPGWTLFLVYLVFAPVALTGTMNLLLWICSGEAGASALASREPAARLALAWSMLILAAGFLALLALFGLLMLWCLLTGRPLIPPRGAPS